MYHNHITHIHTASSQKKKLACSIGCVLFLSIAFGAVTLLLVYTMKPSDHFREQLIYRYRREPFIYSPFSNINLFYYTSIQGKIYGVSDSSYNLTVCATSCPLMKVTALPLEVKGECKKSRGYRNCYVNLLGYHGLYSQDFSQYMIADSNVTFTITYSSQVEPVQLCITTDNDTCSQIFMRSLTDCPKLLYFNQTNNYSQTFTAHVDGYYCAVWLIKQSNQSINYTASLNLASYQLPPAECKNIYSSKFHLNLWHLHHRPKVLATHKQDVCILVQENDIKQTTTTTLLITVVASSLKNLAFILIVGLFIFIVIIVIFVTVICFKCHCTCKKGVKPISFCT